MNQAAILILRHLGGHDLLGPSLATPLCEYAHASVCIHACNTLCVCTCSSLRKSNISPARAAPWRRPRNTLYIQHQSGPVDEVAAHQSQVFTILCTQGRDDTKIYDYDSGIVAQQKPSSVAG